MEVKEAIEKINNCSYIVAWERKDIIGLLEQGDKYKGMWEDLQKTMNSFDNRTGLLFNGEDCRILVNKIEQKYPELLFN